MGWRKVVALSVLLAASATLAAPVFWWRLPSAESEVDAYLSTRDIPADAHNCTSLKYDSDPYAYRCAIATDGRVRIDGWDVRNGATFCFSVPGAHRRFSSDVFPLAPDGGASDCITRALGG